MEKPKTIQDMCIHRIRKGIKSLQNERRNPEAIGTDLEFFFNKLQDANPNMYEELFLEYCQIRLEKEKGIEKRV